jgi:membrane protease YdiL (CAAX protease family)
LRSLLGLFAAAWYNLLVQVSDVHAMTPGLLQALYTALFGVLAVTTANLYQRDPRSGTLTAYLFRAVIVGIILACSGLPLLAAYREDMDGAVRADIVSVPFLCSAFLTAVAVSSAARRWLNRLLPSLVPDRPVHLMGLAIGLFLTASVWYRAVSSGGIAGLAEQIQRTGLRLDVVLLEQGTWILGAVLGVGLFTRRHWNEVRHRLGLRWPGRDDIVWGGAAGAAGLLIVIGVNTIWAQVASADTIAEETAAAYAIAEQYATLPTAFVMSLSVAFGEEILFRGALQPVFGIWLTSLFFAILHVQYAQSSLMIILLLFTLLLAWLRLRLSTTAAIIAHFVYNFAQLILWIALTA